MPSSRQDLLTVARAGIQTLLSDPAHKPAEWKELCEGFLAGVNDALRLLRFEETDLNHILPSFSSDETLITYQQVMEAADA